ncbi:hypothetical protein DPMN_183797 [Dreissena polymorpha]|uniref:Uncharacterized protein n=1 Tax=Dreissena polymorpha TaxID=45954 RepID=A0A9D4DHP2_DREPO|nr:hypothetical protein DPMN_183797 [Dreissena polymorpha]
MRSTHTDIKGIFTCGVDLYEVPVDGRVTGQPVYPFQGQLRAQNIVGQGHRPVWAPWKKYVI